MQRRSRFALSVLLAALVAPGAEAKLKVAASVSDLGAIAREVGGEDVEVEVLAKPTQDPHYVDAKPSLLVTLARADLVLANGMDLEVGWLPVLLTSSRNPRVQKGQEGYLDCSTLITPMDVPLQKLDRSMGDIHPGGNPHYTKDPRNAVPIARGIAARMSALDPGAKDRLAERLRRFEAEAGAALARWQTALAPHRGTPVITYHKSWIYFTAWAGLEEVAFVEPKPGIAPSPQHVAKVLQVIRARKAPLLLQEEWYSAATSELLAKNGNARLVRVSGQTPVGKRYLEHVDEVVRAVTRALPSP